MLLDGQVSDVGAVVDVGPEVGVHVELGVGQVRDPQRRFAGRHGRGGKIGGLLQVLTRHGQVDRPADDLQTILAGSHRMTELLGSQPEAQHRGEYFQYHP